MSTNHLFAYGTLMCADIMQMVAGVSPPGLPATISDYERRRVRGECYPAIIARKGARVHGVFYPSVPEGAWQRLDDFEGKLYERLAVTAVLADGGQISAQAYVIRREYVHVLDDVGWSLAEFLREGKASFVVEHAVTRTAVGPRPGAGHHD